MKEKLMSLVTTLTLGMMSANMVFAIPSGINPGPPDLGDMSGTINKVLGAIQGIGYVVAIIMIMYIGIKYLTAGAGEKGQNEQSKKNDRR